MTNYEKLKQAQSDALEDFCDKMCLPLSSEASSNLYDKIEYLPNPIEKEFFLAGWAAADAFADEQHQHVDNFDKFGNPEQRPTTPDREMMRFEAAKAALTGLLSNASLYERKCSDVIYLNSEPPIADQAVDYADRLIYLLNNE